MMEDAELLRRYAEEKSEAAFAELVRRHLDLVYSTALRQLAGDTHLAQDVAQTVFTDLARKASSLTGRTALTGWLYLGAHHAAAQAVRGEQRRRVREQEASTMHELLSPSTPATDWDRVRPVLDDAMRELTEPDREAVLLRFFEKRPFADIGAALHLTEDAARMRVDRALQKLQLLLARRGITSTASALTAVLLSQAAAAAPTELAATVTGTALASAEATAALNVLQFMSNTKLAVGAAMIVGFLALGTAGYEVHAQREAQASLTAAQQSYDARAARLHDLEQRVQTAERDTAQAAVSLPAAKTVAAWDPVAEGAAFLRRQPEFKQAMVDDLKAEMNFRYDPLYKSRGLSSGQIEQFLKLMTSNWRGRGDTTTPDGKMAVWQSDTPLAPDELLSRLRALLGTEGYAEFVKFNGTLTPRDLVVQVASALAINETPVTPEQSDQLIQIVTTSRARQPGVSTGPAFDWDAVIAKARNVLSAAQLPALELLRKTATSDRTAWEDEQNLKLPPWK